MANIDVTLEELLEAGAHYGHQARRWNPRMASYLYGVREGVHIFDLAKTKELIITALEVLRDAHSKNKIILFVGTKKAVKEDVKALAEKTNSLYVDQRWLGGTLTNFDQIMKSVRRLDEMKQKMASGGYANYTKKERLLIERKIQDLEKSFGGLAKLKTLPDLLVVIDIHKEKGAVLEANRMGIPTIGVVDSNSDPTQVTYPIPMNDDAAKALNLVMTLFENAMTQKQEKATKEVALKTTKSKAKAKAKNKEE